MHVRVRPLNELEAEKGATWKDENNKIFQVNPVSGEPVNESPYVLDNIFGKGWSTQQVYEQTTQALIQKVVGGFNSTVFAYGQTSSGKTHTMRGTEDEPGIIPLAVSEIFDHISRTQEREFLLRVSYMEVQWQHLRVASLSRHACRTQLMPQILVWSSIKHADYLLACAAVQ